MIEMETEKKKTEKQELEKSKIPKNQSNLQMSSFLSKRAKIRDSLVSKEITLKEQQQENDLN